MPSELWEQSEEMVITKIQNVEVASSHGGDSLHKSWLASGSPRKGETQILKAGAVSVSVEQLKMDFRCFYRKKGTISGRGCIGELLLKTLF